MFQFPRFASLNKYRDNGRKAVGLSHSEIPGSMVTCTYPGLIAAYHVLHRLREPRHPPDALTLFRLNSPSRHSENRTAVTPDGKNTDAHGGMLILSAVSYQDI